MLRWIRPIQVSLKNIHKKLVKPRPRSEGKSNSNSRNHSNECASDDVGHIMGPDVHARVANDHCE